MKYSIPQSNSLYWRTIFYTFRAQHILFLAPLYIAAVTTALWMSTPADVPLLLAVLVGPLLLIGLIMTASAHASNKLYADKDGQITLTYDIDKSAITVSANEKLNIEFEKEGFKKSKVFKRCVYIKHKRTSFIIYLPNDNHRAVLNTLKKFGWIKSY